ncbi:MAG: undecaprenyl-diphosphate phosphatase [Candidatus Lokiarchaeota archaeon]|nr:undecaprenyl-diphosphate phosphatase [Candidatus Lokiarchaeota archaeon]
MNAKKLWLLIEALIVLSIILLVLLFRVPLQFLFIAILQGFTEWLPISSSGQTMIVSTYFFGISPENAYSLAIWLHLGTTIAVMVRFRKDFIIILKSLVQKDSVFDDTIIRKRNWIIWATLGTVITAIPLYILFKIIFLDFFTAFQGDVITLLISGLLIITGVILIVTRRIFGNRKIVDTSKKSIQKDSFLSGLIQGVSILPGISRSGITVGTILLEKYDQDDALRLSFLMSVPVAIASILVDIVLSEGSILGTLGILTILITTIVSFIVGYITIDFLIKLAKKINFGYFCILYGIVAFLIIVPFLVFA